MTDNEIFAKCQSVTLLISNLNTLANNVSEKAKAEFDESANKLGGQLAQIDDLLTQFNDSYIATKQGIQAKVDEAESILNEKFDELKSDIDLSIAGNADLFEETKARLGKTEETAKAGSEKIDEINQLLDQEVIVLKQSVIENFESAEEFIVSQCDEIDDAVQTLTSFVEDCQSRVTDELDNTVQAFEEHIQAPVTQLTSNIENAFESLREFISGEIVNACSTKLRDEIIQPLEQEIDKVVKSIQTYMTQFVSNVISGGEGSKQSKQEMEASTQIIEEAIAPVLDALDRVRGLASTVGISL